MSYVPDPTSHTAPSSLLSLSPLSLSLSLTLSLSLPPSLSSFHRRLSGGQLGVLHAFSRIVASLLSCTLCVSHTAPSSLTSASTSSGIRDGASTHTHTHTHDRSIPYPSRMLLCTLRSAAAAAQHTEHPSFSTNTSLLHRSVRAPSHSAPLSASAVCAHRST